MSEMKHFIIGTAGHIDHGKSALVKALTGIDPDRLKEEKERGITIDIGFAHLTLNDDTQVSFIDVPGHEKLIKNMIAGAVGIDAVMLVIAANESVMPQTIEHLQICELLGIKKGFVVITKIDLVDYDDLEIVKMDLSDLLKDTFMANCEIIEVSSLTYAGIDKLKKHLEKLKNEIEEKPKNKLLRMPIDRVFIMKGFGIVVTGTIFEGKVKRNHEIILFPKNLKARIKKIQVHSIERERAEAGERVAINLAHVDKEHIQRGDMIVDPDAFIPARLIEAELKVLNKYIGAFKNFKKLRFYHGTSENFCTLRVIDSDGEKTLFAQLELFSPDVLLINDRFVLRTLSPLETIGGGIVLDLSARKYRKKEYAEVQKKLNELKKLDFWERIEFWVKNCNENGIAANILASKTGMPVQKVIEKLAVASGILMLQANPPIFISAEEIAKLKARVLDCIKNYQLQNPFETGLPKSRLKSEYFSRIHNDIFHYIIHELISVKSLEAVDDYLKVSNLLFEFTKEEKLLMEFIISTYEKSGFTPPAWIELKNKIKNMPLAEKIMFYLMNNKDIIKIDDDIYYHKNSLSTAKDMLVAYLKNHGNIEVSQFKELFNISRKYAIPLLEYFDKSGLTVRIESKRKLRGA